jgi:cytochrome c biogenesis factor
MLNILLSALIIILAFPVGYFLAKVTKEEIKGGRKAFFYLYLICIPIMLVIAFLKIDSQIKTSIILTLFFMMIVSFMSFFLSYKKKF